MTKKTFKYALLFAAATAAVSITACQKDDGPDVNIDEVVEDGIYLTGSATGFDQPHVNSLFFEGKNEKGQELDERISEKYAWLESGTFQITVVEGGEVAKSIGGTAANYSYPGDDREPSTGGDQATGAVYYHPSEGGTFTVSEAGLYHIVYFVGDAETNAVVVVTKADMGLRGGLNGWGFTSLGAPTKVAGGVDFRLEGFFATPGQFKLAYNGGWKLPLDFDDAGEPQWDVMFNTNLGSNGSADGDRTPPFATPDEFVPGGPNFGWTEGQEQGMYTFTLQWRAANAGHGFANFTATRTGDFFPDPADWVVGISGEAVGSWGDPEDDRLAVYSAAESSVTNAETKAGTYVWDIPSLQFTGGQNFKLRVDGGWFGWDRFTIEGDVANFTATAGEDSDVAVGATKTYSLKITVEYSGTAITSRTVAFTAI